MPITDADKLLVNDGSKTETITFSQFKSGTMLNDTDKFLVNDGSSTETVTWGDIQDELGPKGVVNTPEVLAPKDGAGSGEERYLQSDTITKVEGGGTNVYTTDTIASVEDLIINGFDMGGGTVGAQSGGVGTVYSENSVGDIITITPTGGGGSSTNPNVILNNIIDQANQVTFNTNTNSSNTIFECVPTNAIPGGQVVSIQFMISDPDGTVSNTQGHPIINKINGNDILPIKVSGVVIDPVTNYPTGIITFPEGADINNFSPCISCK